MWAKPLIQLAPIWRIQGRHWLLQPKICFIIGVIISIFVGLVLTPTGLIIWHQPQTMHFEEQIPSKLIINPSKMSIKKKTEPTSSPMKNQILFTSSFFPLCLAEIQRIDVSCGCRHLKPAISWRMDWNIAMENPPFVNEFPIRKGHFPASYIRFYRSRFCSIHLEDHPRTCKYLGWSPHFRSQWSSASWKGSHNPIHWASWGTYDHRGW